MRIPYRMIIIVLVLLLLAVFVWQNWAAFNTPGDIKVLNQTTQAPLGLVMLGILGILTLLYLVLYSSMRTASLIEFRRYSKEAEASRKLADEAETSRFGTLQAYLDVELKNVHAAIDAAVGALREEIDTRHNIVIANLGQIDDRLERAGGGESRTVAGADVEEIEVHGP
jgi:uncharacterized integral membrane protein